MYPRGDNFEKEQKHLKTYLSFVFEAGQEVHSINHSLNTTKLKSDSCLNHLAKTTRCQRGNIPFLLGKTHCVKHCAIHKILNFLFWESEYPVILYRIKQNIHLLQENHLMQQEQITEQ